MSGDYTGILRKNLLTLKKKKDRDKRTITTRRKLLNQRKKEYENDKNSHKKEPQEYNKVATGEGK